MAGKLKEFLFPNKSNDELDSTTIVLNSDDIKSNKTNAAGSSSAKILTPKTFSQVETAANELLSGRIVIVDLNSTNIEEAKRICDFLNGVTYALNGKVEKVAKLVYLFSSKVD